MKHPNFELVKNYFEQYNCELLDEYVNNTHKMKFRCSCQRISRISWAQFKISKQCSECGKIKRAKSKMNSPNYVQERFKKRGFEMIGEYTGALNKIKYKCHCGSYGEVTLSNLNHLKGCPSCFHLRRSGPNHFAWNPNKTPEDRFYEKNKRRGYPGYLKFLIEVIAKYNGRCCICGSKKRVEPHHLNAWHWDKEHRTDVNNGEPLCKKCHKEFHKTYGTKNNTREQFSEFSLTKELELDNIITY